MQLRNSKVYIILPALLSLLLGGCSSEKSNETIKSPDGVTENVPVGGDKNSTSKGDNNASASLDFIAEEFKSKLIWIQGASLKNSEEASARWSLSEENTRPGGDGKAIKSGQIVEGESVWIETTVTGPANVSFWWLNSYGQYTSDSMKFFHDGKVQASSNRFDGAEVPKKWKEVKYSLGEGSHVLRWEHSINGNTFFDDKGDKDSGAGGSVWIDDVTITELSSYTEALDAPKLEWATKTLKTTATDCLDEEDCVTGYGNITTTITGPGTIKLWMKVISEAENPDGFFTIKIKDKESNEIEIVERYENFANGQWLESQLVASEGTKILTLEFPEEKWDSPSIGWLDKVEFTSIDQTSNEDKDLTIVESYSQFCNDCALGENYGSCTPGVKLTVDLLRNKASCATSWAKLKDLTELDLDRKKITDIRPIAQLEALKNLDLSWNNISNIPDLSGLKSLEVLNLSENEISDISSLSSLANLNIFDLRENMIIEDFSPVNTLSNLRELNAGYIKNIPSLTGLKGLKKIALSTKAPIDELSGLSSLEEMYIYFPYNEAIDLTPLGKLANLTSLSIEKGVIADISPINKLSNLENLSLHQNKISDLAPIASLTNLKSLTLYRNELSAFSPIASLTNLEELQIEYNDFINIEPLLGLTKLLKLKLAYTKTSDITHIKEFVNLESLKLIGNNISDISPIANLTNLKTVGFGGNKISDLTPLSGLTNIESLHLNVNEISNLGPLANLGNLTSLHLVNNKVTNLLPLSKLDKLKFLDVNGNSISSYAPVSHVTTVYK